MSDKVVVDNILEDARTWLGAWDDVDSPGSPAVIIRNLLARAEGATFRADQALEQAIRLSQALANLVIAVEKKKPEVIDRALQEARSALVHEPRG